MAIPNIAGSAVDELLLVEAFEDDECFDEEGDFMSDLESEDEENSFLSSVYISAVELSSYDDIANAFIETVCGNEELLRDRSFLTAVKDYSDKEFSRCFRMTRKTFQSLLQVLEAGMSSKSSHKIPLESKLLITLWLLSTSDSFSSMATRFELSKGTIHGIFVEIINAISNLWSEFVRWPTREERKQIAEKLEQKYDIPGVVGVIDCCCIRVKAGKESLAGCTNRKYRHTVILQAVCDDKNVFRDLFIGGTGRMKNAQVFHMSPVYSRMSNNDDFLESDEHLLADEEYPLMPNLLTPYNDSRSLSAEKLLFNSHVSAACCVSKQSFSMLKDRWQRLKYFSMGMKKFIPKVIAVCCCLHNFVLNNENINDTHLAKDCSQVASVSVDFVSPNLLSAGERKRADIAKAFEA